MTGVLSSGKCGHFTIFCLSWFVVKGGPFLSSLRAQINAVVNEVSPGPAVFCSAEHAPRKWNIGLDL
jgi:hypothetical protein